jgi:uncharacterized protein (DUF2164 family)
VATGVGHEDHEDGHEGHDDHDAYPWYRAMIKLSSEVQTTLQASIKRYFVEHMDEEIGDLKAGLLLDYVLKEVGPVIYNRAIADAQKYFQERTVDLDSVCYEPEFTYWAPKPGKRG